MSLYKAEDKIMKRRKPTDSFDREGRILGDNAG